MAAATYFDQIQKIYIAFYQRPADPAGLRYWAGKVNDAGGDLGQVINAFAASTEANTLYGAIDASTIGGVIDSLYLALFNRPPEAAGRQFYIDSMAAGTFTPASIALAVLVGAQERDNDAIEHKLQVANEFTQQVDGRPLSDPEFGDSKGVNSSYAGSDAEAAARAILAGVTADPATVLTPEQVTSTLQTDIAQPGDPILDGNTGGGGGDTGGGGGGDTGGGGGPPPTPTFSVALDAVTGALTFAGTATGAITFSVDASGNVTFTRGGTVAADTVALSAIHSAPTGTTFKLSTTAADLTVVSANTLKTASWIDFTAASYRIKDSTANILAELNSSTGDLNQGSPLAQASAIVATDAMTTAEFAIPGLAERMAEGSVTLELGTNGATPEQLALIVTHINKVAEGGITAITLTPAQATAQLLASAALKDGAVTLSDAVDAAYLSALSPAQLAKIAEGYSLSDTLAHLQTLSAEVLAGASSYTLTDDPDSLFNLNAAQIALVQDASNADDYDVVAPGFASVSSSGNTVVLTFSEAIQAGSGNIVIKSAADDNTVAIIDVANATISDKSLSVTLQAALTADESYYVEVAAGVVKDTVGNNFAGITNPATTAGFTGGTPFDVTLDPHAGSGFPNTYHVGTGHGAVEVTQTSDSSNTYYTFTPERGEAKTIGISDDFFFYEHELEFVVNGPLVLTGTAAALANVQITGSGSVTVRGSDDYQELSIQTTGSNTIEAGAGTDWVTLGDGADKVVIKGGTPGTASDSIPTFYDTIMFFDLAHDTIALPTTDILQSGPHTLPNNGGSLDTVKVSFGVVTEFILYDGSGNLENKINAVLEVLGDNKAAVAFVHGTNTYVLYGDGEAGTQSSDIVVQLTGVVGVTSLGFSASSGTLVLA